MNETTEPRTSPSAPAAADPATASALSDLVAEGTLTAAQAERVAAVLGSSRGPAPVEPAVGPGPRGRLAEIAGYLGAALLLGAAALFLSNGWEDLSETARVVILAGVAVLLGVAGWSVAASSRLPMRVLAGQPDSARRRLVSVLWTSGAVAAAAATGLAADSWELAAASAVGLVVAAAGYALVPGVVGQLGMWVGSVTLVSGLVSEIGDRPNASPYALALVPLGAVWVVLGLTAVVRDREVAFATGAAVALFGAQLPVFDGDNQWLAYALTAGVAVAGFAGYLETRSWSVLGAGVLATTIVVPEALHDWTDGSVSAAGSLLVAGLTLLAASAAGLRLRRETVQSD